ncbi:hypothetical protein CRE_02747 [Caenorhabditis remanei]|uniref:Polymerase nucleotidyl transferase domain-containing protein n=1 Tax=Caenorhabditis remanei TaxID=31234 RepID=E3NRA9_CAERE|nr:hypothetical protein CRE_02747 [Caenorhabditis remanei]
MVPIKPLISIFQNFFSDKELRATPSQISLSSSALSSLIPIYTYIFISGLTVSYAFIRANPSPQIIKRPITWLVFYFHRWIRLTSALMVFIGFFDAYGKYIQGPYDALTGYSMVTQTDQCTYWKDIIHVSNFVAVDEMCYLPAWHLAVDFQFTLVAPLFLIAFYYSAKMGTTLAVIASLAGSGFTIYFFLKNNILHSAFTGDHVFDDKLVELILSKPWNQMAPYMIGMIVGYFLAEKAGSRRIIHPVASAIIWVIVSVLAVSALMFGNVGTRKQFRNTTRDWLFNIVPTGSSVTGLATANSDLDVAIHIPQAALIVEQRCKGKKVDAEEKKIMWREMQLNILQIVRLVLTNNEEISQMIDWEEGVNLVQAQIQILKLKTVDGIEFDISVVMDSFLSSMHNSFLIKQMVL